MSIDEKGIQFDPGWNKLYIHFPNCIDFEVKDIKKFKAINQIKFQITKAEAKTISLLKKCVSIYLGCLLWGGFVSQRFKEEDPKEVINNPNLLIKEELKEGAISLTYETDFILNFIEELNNCCKFYLKRPLNIEPKFIEIIKAYREFVIINNNFSETKKTSDVKLPQSLNHFKNISIKDLDILKNTIEQVIASEKPEEILKLGFYKK